MIRLTYEEIKKVWGSGYQYGDASDLHRSIAKAQLKKVVELLEDALENSFVMAYVGENEPYESTIDPITIREIIDDMRQSLLEKVKE